MVLRIFRKITSSRRPRNTQKSRGVSTVGDLKLLKMNGALRKIYAYRPETQMTASFDWEVYWYLKFDRIKLVKPRNFSFSLLALNVMLVSFFFSNTKNRVPVRRVSCCSPTYSKQLVVTCSGYVRSY